MRFEVPQFIDVEDKIFGPLTFKQFAYLAGGGGLAYVAFKLLPLPLNIIGGLLFIALGLLLAFYKINNQTFVEIAQAFLAYQIKGKLYIWKRAPAKVTQPVKQTIPTPPPVPVKIVTDKTITDLAQNLDILDTRSSS